MKSLQPGFQRPTPQSHSVADLSQSSNLPNAKFFFARTACLTCGGSSQQIYAAATRTASGKVVQKMDHRRETPVVKKWKGDEHT